MDFKICRHRLLRCSFWETVILLLLACALPIRSQTPREIRIGESQLRALLIHEVRPDFPTDALGKHASGVSVAQIDVGADGSVIHIEVLQAPTESMAAAMKRALNQWKFRPDTVNGVPIGVLGKITYYFVIDQGKGKVLAPSEMGVPTAAQPKTGDNP
jgi:TonB family protein